jgi:hypothetical protein
LRYIQNLVRQHEGTRPLGGLRYGWEHNIEMNVKEIECESVGWFNLDQDRRQWQSLVKMVINGH